LLVVSPWAGGNRRALGAETRVPFDSFFELYVDHPRRHVFVSGGSGTNGVLVFGFDGRLVKRLADLPGASDLLVDGTQMYVALSNSNAIGVVDLNTLRKIDTIDVSPYAQPRYLSKSRDTIYFSHACDGYNEGSFASVDLVTRVAVAHDDPNPNTSGGCAEHAVLPNDPNTMFVWQAGSSTTIRRYNVTARRPVLVNESEEGLFSDLEFSNDGETFYSNSRSYYESGQGVEQRRISDFGLVRNYPRAGHSYAVTPDDRYIFSTSSGGVRSPSSSR
jgi:YVTN family beta-propeller protein